MATSAELQADLTKVNTAIGQMIAGERLTRFKIGSGVSVREYEYSTVTLENLIAERTRLTQELAVAEGTSVSFRTSSVMYGQYNKFAR